MYIFSSLSTYLYSSRPLRRSETFFGNWYRCHFRETTKLYPNISFFLFKCEILYIINTKEYFDCVPSQPILNLYIYFQYQFMFNYRMEDNYTHTMYSVYATKHAVRFLVCQKMSRPRKICFFSFLFCRPNFKNIDFPNFIFQWFVRKFLRLLIYKMKR